MSKILLKRGTPESWHLGPELIDFTAFEIANKDYVVECTKNRIVLSLRVGHRETVDVNSQHAGREANGINLVLAHELVLNGEYLIQCEWSQIDGASYTAGVSGWTGSTSISGLSNGSPGYGTHTISTVNTDTCFCFTWAAPPPSAAVDYIMTVEIKLSVRKTSEQDTLDSGELGCEFVQQTDGSYIPLIKCGTKTTSGSSNWDDCAYVGQFIPKDIMYGNSLPTSGKEGQIFFLKAT